MKKKRICITCNVYAKELTLYYLLYYIIDYKSTNLYETDILSSPFIICKR